MPVQKDQDENFAGKALGIILFVGAVLWVLSNSNNPQPVPDPTPIPTPVVPDDTDGVVVKSGLGILIVTDNANFANVSRGQVEAIYSKACRDWVDAHCDKTNGSTDFRVMDKASGFHEADAKWRVVVKEHPPERYPWLYISDGRKGTQGDVRNSPAEQLKLYESWAKK